MFHNLNIIEKQIGNINKIAIVLKDNAYGHGLIEIAKLANNFGIKIAVVRTIDEAIKIKDLFNKIIVLADKKNKNLPKNISITINNLKDIDYLDKNLINWIRKKNMSIMTFTITKQKQLIKAQLLGVDGVFMDDPHLN